MNKKNHNIRFFIIPLKSYVLKFTAYLKSYDLLRGFWDGFTTPLLPKTLITFNNYFFVRVFRIIGGFCLYLRIMVITEHIDVIQYPLVNNIFIIFMGTIFTIYITIILVTQFYRRIDIYYKRKSECIEIHHCYDSILEGD